MSSTYSNPHKTLVDSNVSLVAKLSSERRAKKRLFFISIGLIHSEGPNWTHLLSGMFYKRYMKKF